MLHWWLHSLDLRHRVFQTGTAPSHRPPKRLKGSNRTSAKALSRVKAPIDGAGCYYPRQECSDFSIRVIGYETRGLHGGVGTGVTLHEPCRAKSLEMKDTVSPQHLPYRMVSLQLVLMPPQIPPQGPSLLFCILSTQPAFPP